MRGLSLVVASGGHSSSRCAGLSLSRPLLLQSTGSRRAGSVALAHGPSRSAACGIFPDQGSNPCPLHWQADSQPLRHQGSHIGTLLNKALSHKFCLRICFWGTRPSTLRLPQATLCKINDLSFLSFPTNHSPGGFVLFFVLCGGRASGLS